MSRIDTHTRVPMYCLTIAPIAKIENEEEKKNTN